MTNIPVAPMGVGKIIRTGFRLYRDLFSTYLPIGAIAGLWSLVPFLVLLPIPFLLIAWGVSPAIASIPPVIWAALPVWLILFVFATAKSLTNLALISRLAFGTLVDRPETPREAKSHVMPRMGKFLTTYFLQILLITAGFLGFLILAGITTFLGGIFLGGLTTPGGTAVSSSPFSSLIYGILFLLAIIAIAVYLAAFIRFIIGLDLAQVSLAVEDRLTAWGAIKRSEGLVKGNAGRIFLILSIVGLISLPLSLVANLVSSLIVNAVALDVSRESPVFQSIEFLISLSVSSVFSIVILPLYQIVKAAIYYNLRARKEGV